MNKPQIIDTPENCDSSSRGMLTAGAPPTKLLFNKVGPDGKEKIHHALAEIVENRFGSGPISIVNVATVGRGNVP